MRRKNNYSFILILTLFFIILVCNSNLERENVLSEKILNEHVYKMLKCQANQFWGMNFMKVNVENVFSYFTLPMTWTMVFQELRKTTNQ
jgi:hydroxymethylglutaryl-CoA reductase